jgi:methylglutaconyl-CoA hydratase
MQTIRVEEKNNVTYLWFNRPHVRNAMSEELMQEVSQVVETLPATTRALVLAGEGALFCAGGDLNWMKRSIHFSYEENLNDVQTLIHMMDVINKTPCVTIARVHGAAMGGALGVIAACDVVIAEEKTQFAFTEVRLGIIPSVISPFVLPKIGQSAARRYYLTGQMFDTRAALHMGLVHEAVPQEQLDECVAKTLKCIEQAGPVAVKEAKEFLQQAGHKTSDEMLTFSRETLARLRTSPEGQEGVGAFLEKRRPRW